MLYALNRNEYVTEIPHKADYNRWRRNISDADYRAAYDELLRRIDGSEIQTSSWIPGADWEGTVFQPLYTDACQQDHNAAARFFGLLLWHVVLEHPEVWGFGRYEKDGMPIEGMTYFRLKTPPLR